MLFTIGTSNRTQVEFVVELQLRGVTVIVDVRSSPYSRLPWFNSGKIAQWATEAGIDYRQMGHLAEAIVALALEPQWEWCSADYASWDFERCADHLRLEVKHSAALQSWHVGKVSRASFDIAARYEWIAGKGWCGPPYRQANIYVFAHHPVTDEYADHRDPQQWQFYVVRTEALPDGKRIGLSAVQKLSSACGFDDLRDRVDEVAQTPLSPSPIKVEKQMKTLREQKVGKTTLRLVESGKDYVGLLILGKSVKANIKGDNPDAVWQELFKRAGEASPEYFGFAGARARFLKHFPGGFGSDEFDSWERAYKLEAKTKLDTLLPLEKALDGVGMGAAALKAYQATNLLSVFEKTKLSPLLKGDNADEFVRAVARFAMGDYKPALSELDRLAGPYESAKWTVITYLPFLWLPDTHMFLKPTVTKDFSERVGHPFIHDYSTELVASVYESLLDLAGQTQSALVDLGPRDNIDIQSFIWIVGEYKDDDGPLG